MADTDDIDALCEKLNSHNYAFNKKTVTNGDIERLRHLVARAEADLPSYEKTPVNALRKKCRDQNIEFQAKATKDELVELLYNAEKEAYVEMHGNFEPRTFHSFLSLAPELQLKVYDEYFKTLETNASTLPLPPLLATSKEVRRAALPELYDLPTSRFRIQIQFPKEDREGRDLNLAPATANFFTYARDDTLAAIPRIFIMAQYELPSSGAFPVTQTTYWGVDFAKGQTAWRFSSGNVWQGAAGVRQRAHEVLTGRLTEFFDEMAAREGRMILGRDDGEGIADLFRVFTQEVRDGVYDDWLE